MAKWSLKHMISISTELTCFSWLDFQTAFQLLYTIFSQELVSSTGFVLQRDLCLPWWWPHSQSKHERWDTLSHPLNYWGGEGRQLVSFLLTCSVSQNIFFRKYFREKLLGQARTPCLRELKWKHWKPLKAFVLRTGLLHYPSHPAL